MYNKYYYVKKFLLGLFVCGMNMYGECTHCKIQLYFQIACMHNAKIELFFMSRQLDQDCKTDILRNCRRRKEKGQ